MFRPSLTLPYLLLLLAAANLRAQAPAAPTLTFPGDMAQNVVVTTSLKWKKVSGATGYHVQLDTGASFAMPVFEDSTLTDTTAKAPKLSDSTRFFWRVRAANAAGFGAWSKLRSFTTNPPLGAGPTTVAPDFGAEGTPLFPTLVWNSFPGTKTYAVQVSITSNFATLVFSDTSVADTTRKVSGLEKDVLYYWHVRANTSPVHTAWTKSAFSTAEPASVVREPKARRAARQGSRGSAAAAETGLYLRAGIGHRADGRVR